MAAITKVSTLDSLIQVIVGEATYTFRHNPVMRQCVDVRNFPNHAGSPIDFPKYGKVTAYSLTEGVAMGEQAWSDTDVSITPGEVGLKVIITKAALKRGPASLERDLADECNRAIAYKLDYDLLALLDGFSSSKGSANAALTVAHLQQAISMVQGNATEPGPPPYFIVLHPYQLYDIGAAIGVGATYPVPTGISEEVLRHWVHIPVLLGATVFYDGNIVVDASDDAKGGVFSKSAIRLCVTQEPEPVQEYIGDLRATELDVVMEYGYAEWSDSMGVEIYTDAGTPA